MAWSLLERDAHNVATVSDLDGTVANKQVRKVLDRYFPLKGYATTTCGIRAGALWR